MKYLKKQIVSIVRRHGCSSFDVETQYSRCNNTRTTRVLNNRHAL